MRGKEKFELWKPYSAICWTKPGSICPWRQVSMTPEATGEGAESEYADKFDPGS